MYPKIRVDKRIPDGSVWQARRGYLLPAHEGWARVYEPRGTRWSNQHGGWTAEVDGISLFDPSRPFTIACFGPQGRKHFYVDIIQSVRVEADSVDFVDLFLDVLIDPEGGVSEKDEHQLAVLPADLRASALSARDLVRQLINTHDPLFNARSAYYEIPNDAARLAPLRDPIPI